MVDLTFLGTGGAFSAGLRTNTALLIQAPQFTMLVEAGPPVMNQLARAGIGANDIEWLFVSHPHGDHMLGFPMLALSRLDATTSLHVHAGYNTIARLKILWDLVFPGLTSRELGLAWHEHSEEIVEQNRLTDQVTLRTAPVPGPPGVPTLAARWKFAAGPTITFITDTYPTPASAELARGSDLLIHEASFSATLEPGVDAAAYFHSTARQAGEIARQAGCGFLALVHLGHQICDDPTVLVDEARAGTTLSVLIPEENSRISL